MAIKTVFITSGTTFTIPSDFGSLVSVECLGAGAGSNVGLGSGGGGGGSYAKVTTISGLVASALVSVQIGAGGTLGTPATAGGDTWFNNTTTVFAQGGQVNSGLTGGLGGQSARDRKSVV